MRYLFLLLSFTAALNIAGQRSYRSNSVLAAGAWFKLAVKEAGVYRIDLPLLQSLGISTSNLSSNTIRLFGNGGAMLPEDNISARPDDLVENAIMVVDGNDGVLNGQDYILFYANGSDTWLKDSANKRFRHRKNLYADRSFYFLNISTTENGLRVQTRSGAGAANQVVTNFRDRYFYELDSLNLLRSGKEWLGEEFGSAPGKQLNRSFQLNVPNALSAQPSIFISNVAVRSVGAASGFLVRINNTPVVQHLANPTGAGQYDPVAVTHEAGNSFSAGSSLSVQYSFQAASVNAQGWLNWFELFVQRQLSMSGTDQLLFRDWESVGPGNIAEFRIQGATAQTQVWDVTQPLRPVAVTGTLAGSELRFSAAAVALREYVAFNSQNFLRPETLGRINNQDLHNSAPADYIVITHAQLLPEAQRLANWHRQQHNLRTAVVTTEQVFHEFASGTPDPTALRDFIKMYYDKAASNAANRPRYLLLMGDGSYDFKDRVAANTNLVPVFESEASFDPLATYTSDDFFGLLDDGDDVNRFFPVSLLDIGIGRIPAKNLQEARNVVDKIIRYHAKESFGPWRNEITLVADDEDNNLHLDDAEFHASVIQPQPVFQANKIYLDAFRQQSGSGGSRYPEVNQAINNRIFSGTLIWNYSGHGGFRRLAEEVILDQDMVNTWTNADRLPLFVTATCDFAPFDNPGINSLGENILLRERTGAIALMTTTRVVFAFSNRIINNAYFQVALTPGADGQYPTLGESTRQAKNNTYQNFGDIINNRKFLLLGDPAMRLGFPSLKVRTTLINNQLPGADTLRALDRYTIKGEVVDANGLAVTGFNGNVYPVIYDKPQLLQTRRNDPGSQVVTFQTQQNVVFKGKAKVTNGQFSYTFVVPKDINYQFGNGKVSYYAENGVLNAAGAETGIIVGGATSNPTNDQTGPQVRGYMNDEKFVNGGITNQTPVLLLRLFDSSGINTVGTGIGHDITATLDGDANRFFVLNDFYEADADSYQKGTVRFQMPTLEEGPHTLKIKVWDVANNSADYQLDFRVVKDQQLKIDRLLNYPNPFTSSTTFMFEHNRPGENLAVTLRVFTVSGKLVKSFLRTINNAGNRSFDIEWDGTNEYGVKVGRGVYIYSVEVRDARGQKQTALQKLVVL